MIKKLRFWLADKFLSWAMRLDFDMVLEFVMTSHDAIITRAAELEAERKAAARAARPKRKIGRPLGSKDKAPRKRREGVKLGRPLGSKDRVGVRRA